MADYKKNIFVCYHLARRLRHDHPKYYYRIIKLGSILKFKFNWKCYPLKNLSNVWTKFYLNDTENYKNTIELFSSKKADILNTYLLLSKYCFLGNFDSKNSTQILKYPDITLCDYSEKALDSLDILIINSFRYKNHISKVLENLLKIYLDNNLIESKLLFQKYVLKRIYGLMYLGILIKI
jgi:hypothetical protein